jgi:hypothetical protein
LTLNDSLAASLHLLHSFLGVEWFGSCTGIYEVLDIRK